MNIEIIRYRLPIYWIGALINGDYTGISNEEAQEIAIKVKEGTATLDEIAHLISFIKENGGIEYAVQTMNVYKQKAFNLLASLPDSDICAALRAYLDYVVDREK